MGWAETVAFAAMRAYPACGAAGGEQTKRGDPISSTARPAGTGTEAGAPESKPVLAAAPPRANDAPGRGRGPGRRRTPSPTAIEGARRYSRFVRLMKYLLPALAAGIIAILAIYSAVYDADDTLTVTFSESPTLQHDRRMVSPRFTGSDNDAQSYAITAESAEQSAVNESLILMQTLKASIGLADGQSVALTAATGAWDMDAERLALEGLVTLESSDGYRFKTQSVAVDVPGRSITGPAPVTGSGPAGSVEAERFRVLDNGAIVRFEGGVRFRFEPGQFSPNAATLPASSAGARVRANPERLAPPPLRPGAPPVAGAPGTDDVPAIDAPILLKPKLRINTL